MRTDAGDPHLVDVELVEDPPSRPRARGRHVPAARPAAAAADGPRPRDRRRSRHARPWVAAGVVVVLGLVGWALNRAEARRQEVQLAALANLPGYLDPIDEPLAVAWRAPGAEPAAWAGTVLLVGEPGGGVGALDLVTGRELWRRGPAADECHVLPERTGPQLPVATAVVCLPDARTGAAEVAPPRVVVLDPEAGREVDSLTLRNGTSVELVAGVVVLHGTAPDGAVAVQAWDPVSGSWPWSFTVAADGSADVRTDPGWSHRLGAGTIVLESHGAQLSFDVATGRSRTTARARPSVEQADLPGHREVRWRRDRFGRPRDVVVVDHDAGTRIAAPGLPWTPPVNEGVAGDVVVVRRTTDQHLLGLAARTGQVRWDLSNVAWLHPAVQVGGTVVAVSPASASALDVGTGLRLWNHPVARGAAAWRVLTDGRVVLLPSDDDAGVWLVARSLQTGEEDWRVPLPGAVLSVDEVDGRTVLVRTTSGLVALR